MSSSRHQVCKLPHRPGLHRPAHIPQAEPVPAGETLRRIRGAWPDPRLRPSALHGRELLLPRADLLQCAGVVPPRVLQGVCGHVHVVPPLCHGRWLGLQLARREVRGGQVALEHLQLEEGLLGAVLLAKALHLPGLCEVALAPRLEGFILGRGPGAVRAAIVVVVRVGALGALAAPLPPAPARAVPGRVPGELPLELLVLTAHLVRRQAAVGPATGLLHVVPHAVGKLLLRGQGRRARGHRGSRGGSRGSDGIFGPAPPPGGVRGHLHGRLG
mmetsp:Transcript_15273/g.51537  ORF Transcript_15273/g.51537 Transcript_15273/m.51537 type:complete len:272 (+) Transcript_15273:193-1008(+)